MPAYNELYSWQKTFLKTVAVDPTADKWEMRPSPPRTIHILFDEKGAAGKSTLTSVLCNGFGGGKVIELSGAAKDACHAYTAGLQPFVVYDVARADTKNWAEIAKMAEQLSNGRLMNEKYVSAAITFERPWIFIYCNSLPPNLSDLLSVDRVKIWHVKKPGPIGEVVEPMRAFGSARELDDYIAEKCPQRRAGGMN